MSVTILITTAKYEKVSERTTCRLSHVGLNSSPFHPYLEFKIHSKSKLPKSTAANTLLRTETRAHVSCLNYSCHYINLTNFCRNLIGQGGFSFFKPVKDLTEPDTFLDLEQSIEIFRRSKSLLKFFSRLCIQTSFFSRGGFPVMAEITRILAANISRQFFFVITTTESTNCLIENFQLINITIQRPWQFKMFKMAGRPNGGETLLDPCTRKKRLQRKMTTDHSG